MDRNIAQYLLEADWSIENQVLHTYHNGVRHENYCKCAICRKCFFCTLPRFFKNKAGCRIHYGLHHKNLKQLWDLNDNIEL